jgi:hypothetical protein
LKFWGNTHIPHQLLEEQGFDSPIPTVMAADAIFAGQLFGNFASRTKYYDVYSHPQPSGIVAFFENPYIQYNCSHAKISRNYITTV